MDEIEPYDIELFNFVNSLNINAGREVARIVVDVESKFAKISDLIPRIGRGGEMDWSKAVFSSGPSRDQNETSIDQLSRINGDLKKLVELEGLANNDRIVFLSDEFYTEGIECEVEYGNKVMAEWLQYPHAIFIVSCNHLAWQYIGFARSSYIFSSNRNE